jgi:hypothetical protein
VQVLVISLNHHSGDEVEALYQTLQRKYLLQLQNLKWLKELVGQLLLISFSLLVKYLAQLRLKLPTKPARKQSRTHFDAGDILYMHHVLTVEYPHNTLGHSSPNSGIYRQVVDAEKYLCHSVAL